MMRPSKPWSRPCSARSSTDETGGRATDDDYDDDSVLTRMGGRCMRVSVMMPDSAAKAAAEADRAVPWGTPGGHLLGRPSLDRAAKKWPEARQLSLAADKPSHTADERNP